MELRSKPIDQAIKSNVLGPGGVRVVDYQPGDGTRYLLVFTPVGDALPGATNAMLVSVSNFLRGPSMLVEIEGGFLAPTYVSEKLGVGAPSAVTLAEIIAHFTGRQAYTPEEYTAL